MWIQIVMPLVSGGINGALQKAPLVASQAPAHGADGLASQACGAEGMALCARNSGYNSVVLLV
jgi:hypothetical protein